MAASSSKSDLKWRVTEIARCPICFEDFKTPKSLPCVHTFCLHCLQEHCKDRCPGDEVPCPVCRKEFEIPDNGVDELPHNFFLQNLIDAREASSEQPGEALCEACEKDEETGGNIPPATMYCVDCQQKLCKSCSRAHRAMREPHQVKQLGAELTIELLQQRGSYCDQHAGKQRELYCFDCKLNVCIKCFAVDHTQHKCREVEKVAQDFVKSSKTDVQNVSTRITEFHTSVTQTDQEESKLMRAVRETKTSVKQRGEELKRMVDTQVDDLLEQLQTFETTRQKEIASRKDELEFGIMAMESFTAYSLELMSKGSPCDITRVANDLHARAEELMQTCVTPADYCAADVKFVPMNIDEFTEPRGKQNLIGRVVTSKDVEFDSARQVLYPETRRQQELEKELQELRDRATQLERMVLEKVMKLDTKKVLQTQQNYRDSGLSQSTGSLSPGLRLTYLRADCLERSGSASAPTPDTMRVVETLSGSVRVAGLTCLDDELFVLHKRDDNQVEVYSTKTSADYTRLRQFSVTGLSKSIGNDMTSCVRHKCLYISDRDKKCVHKSTINGEVIAKWLVPDSPIGLSLTANNNLLVTCRKRNNPTLLQLSSESGKCVLQVALQTDIVWPWHAIQLASQHYVVSHGVTGELCRVCIVDVDGQVSLSYGRDRGSGVTQLNCPLHVTVDRDNFIFVADLNNNRVVLLSPSLQVVRHIKLEGRPHRLYLDHVTRCLYVGHVGDDVSVIQM